MNENKEKYDFRCEEHAVRPYEVDANGFLSLVSLCNLFQSVTGNHARELQLSIDDLTIRNQTWVLSRLAVSIEKSPGWGDRIAIKTWPSGIRKLFALRDFCCFDPVLKSNIASGSSAWVIIDSETRKPLRPGNNLDHLHFSKSANVFESALEKLPAPERSEYERTFRVGFSDLDINRHVNNSRYVEWVYETVPPEIHLGYRPVYLEINYLGEAFYCDELRCVSCIADGASDIFRHSVVRVADGHELVRAITKWGELE